VVQQLQEVQSGRIVLPEDRLQQISSEVVVLSSELSQTTSTLMSLNTIVSEIKEARRTAVQLPDTLNMLFTARMNLEAEYNGLNQQIVDLETIVSSLTVVMRERDSLVSSIQNAEREAQELRAQLSTCPSCGSVLTDDTKKVLLGED